MSYLQQFRPQVISVSALFLQILIYVFGRVFAAIIPGPGSKLHKDNWFWNFMNPGPFSGSLTSISIRYADRVT
jgi:hypothetical protein